MPPGEVAQTHTVRVQEVPRAAILQSRLEPGAFPVEVMAGER